jgi:hypothetical protein
VSAGAVTIRKGFLRFGQQGNAFHWVPLGCGSELRSVVSVERQVRTAKPPLCSHAPKLKLGLWQIDLIFGKWSAALSLASLASFRKANSGIVRIISWKFSLTRRFLQMKS